MQIDLSKVQAILEWVKTQLFLDSQAINAKTLGIMKYYADIKAQLDDKLQFITKIKAERNKSQDFISQIREILQVDSDADIIDKIEELEKLLTVNNNNTIL